MTSDTRQIAIASNTEQLNQLEPTTYIKALFEHAPVHFKSHIIPFAQQDLHAFLFKLDIFTTTDDRLKQWKQTLIQYAPWVHNLFKFKTLFIGTPGTEYALFPEHTSASGLCNTSLEALHQAKASLLIIKDIPSQSPLLPTSINQFSETLISHLQQQGFLLVSGQALGYVPIDFRDRNDYIRKLSANARSNIRRKLKSFSKITVLEVPTGDSFFTPEIIQELYQLYLNVFHNSYIHFEQLTLPFIGKILTDASNQGLIFIFQAEAKIIGFSMCFIHQNRLVEKYIGSRPEARQYNLYYLSWFHKLDYCLKQQLEMMIVGCTNIEIKAYLGAQFTQTYHAVYIKNPILRRLGLKLRHHFEADQHTLDKLKNNE